MCRDNPTTFKRPQMQNPVALHDISKDLMPDALRADDYYVANDIFAQQGMKVMDEIRELEIDFDPWQRKFAKESARGFDMSAIARKLKKNRKTLNELNKKVCFKRLVAFWQHYDHLMDGPNEIQRKQMLWRIAVDNERADPKESTKALAELNRMNAPSQKGAGQTLNIVINNALLPQGALDQ